MKRILLVFCWLSLISCGAKQTLPQPTGRWQAVAIYGKAIVIPPELPTLDITPALIRGFSGCSHFTTETSFNETAHTMTMGTTMIQVHVPCAVDRDTDFLTALSLAKTYKLDGTTMWLYSEDNFELLKLERNAPLQMPTILPTATLDPTTSVIGHWQFFTVQDNFIRGTKPLTLNIGLNSISGFDGCAFFTADLILPVDSNFIEFPNLKTMPVECEQSLSSQATTIQLTLANRMDYRIISDTLTLHNTINGSPVVLKPRDLNPPLRTDPSGTWQLIELNNRAVNSKYPLSLELFNQQARGFTGCSMFTSTFNIELERFDSPITADATSCPDDATLEQHQSYLNALSMTQHLSMTNQTLMLFDIQQQPIAKLSLSTRIFDGMWHVESIHGQPVVSDQPLDLVVNNHGVGGFSGCNEFGGTILLNMTSNTITFSRLPSTQKGCEKSILDQESAYQQALRTSTTFEYQGTILNFVDAQGNKLILRRP